MITTRVAAAGDIPDLVPMLRAYMKEALARSWDGSEEGVARDGLGARFETVVAVGPKAGPVGEIVGFAAWEPSYDLHHCVWGGHVMDMYVRPARRGRGVAVALLVTVAARVRERGGSYVMGQSVPDPRVRRMYERLAVCGSGAPCYVGGRAFRVLAELCGAAPKAIARGLPEKAWNHEP